MDNICKEKKKYLTPSVLLCFISESDVITTSGNEDEQEQPGDGYYGEWDPF